MIYIEMANPLLNNNLAWALVISLMLHAVVLFVVHWNVQHKPALAQSSLTVILMPSLKAQPKQSKQEKNLPPSFVKPIQIENSGASLFSEQIQINNSVDTIKSSSHLDMEQLRSQAREYASKELASVNPEVTMEGDYYGTYSGDDTGIFFFHLDKAGHASGSGQSDTRGFGFLINGEVTANGVVQMYGMGKAGGREFKGSIKGQLNISTGKISGSWFVGSLLKGGFSGQNE